MASTLVDLVKINVLSTGTGALLLGSPAAGYRGADALVNGQIYSYSIQQGENWEYGRGTFFSSTGQLSRGVKSSSVGGEALDLSANAEVSFVALSDDINAAVVSGEAINAAAQAVAAAEVASEAAGQAVGATAVKANASALGVAATAADMGTFAGSTIPNEATAKQALQALENALDRFISQYLVGAAPAYIRRLGEKAGEVVSLIDLAGKPSGDDYTSFFSGPVSNYPFKTIQLHQGRINLAGAGISGLNNVQLRGFGPTQTTLFCPSATLNLFEVNDGGHWIVRDLSLQHAPGATAGLGLLVSGTSSKFLVENVYATLNPDGAVHFIGDNATTGAQSGNRIAHLEAVDNGGDQIKLLYSQDWGIQHTEAGRVTGAFGYANSGFWIEESHQGAFNGECKAWDNVNALYGKNSQGCSWGLPSDRFEESRKENIVLDGCIYGACDPRTHTASKSTGIAGTYSAIRLINATNQIRFNAPQIYSWNSAAYLMKNGIEIDSGCYDNLIGMGIIQPAHCLSGAIGGAGASDGTNYISDMIPRASTDGVYEAVFADDAPAGAFVFLTPEGLRTVPYKGGVLPGAPKHLKRVDVATLDTPGSGKTYTYQIYINSIAVGPTFTITNGMFSASSGPINLAVAATDIIVVGLNVANGAVVTSHRATAWLDT